MKGVIDNMLISWRNGKLFIGGSLPKLLTGNNFYNLSIHEIKSAVQILQDKLNVDLQFAKISRLDLATNVSLNKLVENYLPCLGYLKSADRSNINSSSVYYRKKGYPLFVFYDKIKEMKQIFTNRKILKAIKGNYLRFEIRYSTPKQIARKFEKHLVVKDLYNLETNLSFANDWYESYLSIGKEVPLTFNLKKGEGYKRLLDIWLKMAMDSMGGINPAMNALKITEGFIQMRPEYKSRVRSKIRKLGKIDKTLVISPLLQELNISFENTIKYFLLSIPKLSRASNVIND
jgi:hypothetical protein